jgi:hypothetical protein
LRLCNAILIRAAWQCQPTQTQFPRVRILVARTPSIPNASAPARPDGTNVACSTLQAPTRKRRSSCNSWFQSVRPWAKARFLVEFFFFYFSEPRGLQVIFQDKALLEFRAQRLAWMKPWLGRNERGDGMMCIVKCACVCITVLGLPFPGQRLSAGFRLSRLLLGTDCSCRQRLCTPICIIMSLTSGHPS